MNYSMIRYIEATVVMMCGVFMLLPALVGFIYAEPEGWVYLIVAVSSALAGFLVRLPKPRSKVFFAREGFVTVSVSWLILSLISAIPFVLTKEYPSYLDAVFETVSGYTTTGGTTLTDVEHLTHCTQFWRTSTHWVGGMGVLVLVIAILPLSGGYNMHLMRAESPGPVVGKLVPKVRNTARILYEIYLGITVLEIICLKLTGLPWFDSIVMSFSTVGTGGFGLLNSSAGAYSTATIIVLMVFMFLCGVSFTLYYMILSGRFKDVVRSEELWTYVGIVIGSTLLIAWNVRGFYSTGGQTILHSGFQVLAFMTTTGFTTVDFNVWPSFAKTILFMLMIIGACAGSTGGGFKVSRLIVLIKSIRNEMSIAIHPRTVRKTHLDGRPLPDSTGHSIRTYVVIYIAVYLISLLIVSLDGLSFETNASAVMSAFNNIGPAFDLAASSYACFGPLSKIVLMFDMLAGRLELIPVLVLLSGRTWKK